MSKHLTTQKPSATAEKPRNVKNFGSPTGDYYPRMEAEKIAHTPGKWKFVPNEQQPMLREIQSDRGIGICHVYHLRNQNWEANARLIAAAPELLQTLKDIQHNAEVMCNAEPNPVWIAVDDQCRAAIAKAEGLSQSVATPACK